MTHNGKKVAPPAMSVGKMTLLGLLCFILFIALFSLMDSRSAEEKTFDKAQQEKERLEEEKYGHHCLGRSGKHLWVNEHIKENLNDPKSFEHISTKSTEAENGWHTAYVSFRARNGFGALTVGHASAEFHKNCKGVRKLRMLDE